jgi:hypothetical protein
MNFWDGRVLVDFKLFCGVIVVGGEGFKFKVIDDERTLLKETNCDSDWEFFPCTIALDGMNTYSAFFSGSKRSKSFLTRSSFSNAAKLNWLICNR